jgi:hypothetical protein
MFIVSFITSFSDEFIAALQVAIFDLDIPRTMPWAVAILDLWSEKWNECICTKQNKNHSNVTPQLWATERLTASVVFMNVVLDPPNVIHSEM